MAVVVATRIDRVTVYRNGALVVRRGALPDTLDPEGRLEVRGLPLLYGHDTLRLRTEQAAVRLGAVEEVPDLDVHAEQEGEAAELREAEDALHALEAEAAAMDELGSLLADALDPDEGELPDTGDLVPALGAVLDDQARLIALREHHAASRVELDLRVQRARERLQALQARKAADHPQGRPARVTRALSCAFEAERGGGVLEVEYFVRGARWAPVYELHVSGAEATLHLAAQVAQATGEDWEGAAIALSTADLRRETRLPKLGEWRIGRTTSKPPTAWRALPEDLDGLFADHDRAAPPPPKPRPPPMQPMSSSVAMHPLEEAADVVRSSPKRAKRRRSAAPMMGGAIAPAAAPAPAPKRDEPAPPPPTSSVDPGRLLDYAWLQLPGWTDPRRGKLVHVGLESRLRDFVEARGGEPADLEEIRGALRALREQQRRLDAAPLPPGCQQLRATSFHHRYHGGPRVRIGGDGRWHRVLVQQAGGRCHELYRVVPKHSDRVYRFAVLKNPLGQPLASGPLEVYVDGTWQVRSSLDGIGAGGTLRLNLGVEEGLRVARHVVYDEVEHGMLSTESVLTHRIRTEVRNLLGQDVRVQIFEQLPEPEDAEDVQVSLGDLRPAPVRDRGLDGQEQDGALRWDLDVPAGRSAEASWTYTITLPAKRELVGGNRREP